MEIRTDWVTGGVSDGYAFYGDATGVYRISLENKEKEYILTAEKGQRIAIYFMNDEGGVYCVRSDKDGSAILYVKAGAEPVCLLTGKVISHMAIWEDTLCYGDEGDLYTVRTDGTARALLYDADLEELGRLSGLWACGLGYVARYSLEIEEDVYRITIVPLTVER